MQTAIYYTPATVSSEEPTSVNNNETIRSVYVAGETLLNPHTKHHVLVMTTATGINTVKPRILAGTSTTTSAAREVVYIVLSQWFHIFVSNCFTKAMQLSNHTVAAYGIDGSAAKMITASTLRQ